MGRGCLGLAEGPAWLGESSGLSVELVGITPAALFFAKRRIYHPRGGAESGHPCISLAVPASALVAFIRRRVSPSDTLELFRAVACGTQPFPGWFWPELEARLSFAYPFHFPEDALSRGCGEGVVPPHRAAVFGSVSKLCG